MTLELAVLLVASVLLVSLGAARIGSRLGLPVLLLFLAMGLGLGAIYPFNNASLAHDLGFAALVLILGEGGYTTRWREIRPALGAAGLLATLGVMVSIGAMAAFGHYVLGLDLATATILGAVTAPTDSAAIFAVLRRGRRAHRDRGDRRARSVRPARCSAAAGVAGRPGAARVPVRGHASAALDVRARRGAACLAARRSVRGCRR